MIRDRSLGLSADTITVGEMDLHVYLAQQIALEEFARLLKDPKADPKLSVAFAGAEAGSEGFSDLARSVAFERAGTFQRMSSAERRDQHMSQLHHSASSVNRQVTA